MFRIDLQLFASKKGVGSSRNGRDSESKRLGIKREKDSSFWQAIYWFDKGYKASPLGLM